MRPITLTITAFGPFANTQVVDFTKLGERTMFLIEGPIGSGKTSILDAICFALFGVSSGDERAGPDLRSQHAEPSRLTEVEFEFELGAGRGAKRYRVKRAPAQSRPPQRGSGALVPIGATATLWEITANGPIIATDRGRISDIDEKIVQLLGVSADQFRQVIILPQGKFREFLAADSTARKDVLEKLFGTEIYRRIENELLEAEKAARDTFSKAERNLDVILAPRGVPTVAALSDLRDRQAELAVVRRAEADAATAQATQAATALAAGTTAVTLISDRDAALAAVTELETGLPVHEENRERLDAGRRAFPVKSVDEQVASARTRRDTAVKELAASRATADASHEVLEAARALLEAEVARRPERDRAVANVQELERLGAEVATLATLRESLTETQARAAKDSAAVASAEAVANAASAQLDSLLEQITTLGQQAARLDGARLQADVATGRLIARHELEAFRTSLATETAKREEAEIEATRATDARTALEARISELRGIAARQEGAALLVTVAASGLKSRQILDADREALAIAVTARDGAVTSHATTVTALEAARNYRDATFHAWTSGLAGRLATNLAEGEACPVCGSDHHPVRATVADGAPTDEDLDAADHALKGAAEAERRDAQAVASRQSEVDALEGRVATAVEALGADATVILADLQGRKAQADADLGAIATAIRDLAGAETGLDADRNAERHAAEVLVASRTAVTDLEARVGAATRTLGDDAIVPLADLQGRKEQADADLHAATKANSDLADATGREPAVRRAADEASAHALQAREAAAQAQSALDVARTRVEVASGGIPPELSTLEALVTARHAANSLVATLEADFNAATLKERDADGAHINAVAAVAAAVAVDRNREAELEQVVAGLGQAVQRAGFGSVESWREALLDPAILDDLQARVEAFESERVRVHAHATRATDAAVGVIAPDMEALRLAEATAKAASETATGAVAIAETVARQLVGDVTRAGNADRAVTEARSRYERVSRLASLARGQTADNSVGYRISFQSWVLARFLDDVLKAATRRLLKVSLGRYEVKRRGGATNRRAQAGLEIEILDRYTNQTRDARTLSGGEGFQASLSLAFGLSDVVQQHMGGVHLDCIFVDEGFGSLDPEALENALQMLIELQQGGRLVGIISHVGDLRQHIDARLTLTKTANGSTATFHV